MNHQPHNMKPNRNTSPRQTTPRSKKLRSIMEARAGFWLSRGITLTFLLFLLLFLLLWLIPLDRFGGQSVISYLVG